MIRMTVRKTLMPALLALAIAPLSLAVSAADHGDASAKGERYQQTHAEHRQAMQERLTTLVDGWELSDAEREALTEVRESMYRDMRELHDQDFDSRDERREAYRALRDEHRAALAEILDEQQLEELKAAMQPKHRHGKRGDKPERDA